MALEDGTGYSTNQPINRSINQSINQSTHQSVNQPTKESTSFCQQVDKVLQNNKKLFAGRIIYKLM